MKEIWTPQASAYLKDPDAFKALVDDRVVRAGEAPGPLTNPEAIGISATTWWRLMERPDRPISPQLAGMLLAAFPDRTFRDLFTHEQPSRRPRQRELVAA